MPSAIAALTLIAGGAVAKDPAGNEVLSFEFDNPPVYIECVGEIVNGHVVGETRDHEFTTPSGAFHIVDQWRFKVYQTGTIRFVPVVETPASDGDRCVGPKK